MKNRRLRQRHVLQSTRLPTAHRVNDQTLMSGDDRRHKCHAVKSEQGTVSRGESTDLSQERSTGRDAIERKRVLYCVQCSIS